MARIRTVKPELRRDLTVASWPIEVRYYWVLLWGTADDDGRADDDARLLKADCFPLDDNVTVRKVEAWTERLRVDGRICRYEVDGRKCLHVINWKRHQRINRPSISALPPCPHHEREAHEEYRKAHAEVVSIHGALTESSLSGPGTLSDASPPEQGTGNREQGTRKRSTPPPDNLEISPDMRSWAAVNAPDVRLIVETARMLDWARGKGERKTDWEATWRNWMRRAQDDLASQAQPPKREKIIGAFER